jgi:N utilization substance protein A
VDPVGACVGPRGSRVRMVVSELRGEKIDIIPYNDEPARFVAKALSPARVREVLVDDENRSATVVVPDDQLSLAIGREGQNARLAARLTGWRIDIKSETEWASEDTSGDYEQEETGGRCAAVLANGRRCPNAALPQSRFCGVEAHQALEAAGTTQLGPDGQPVLPGDEIPAEPVDADQAAADEQELEELTEVEAAGASSPADQPPASAEQDSPSADDPALEPAPEASEPEAVAADEPVAEEQA